MIYLDTFTTGIVATVQSTLISNYIMKRKSEAFSLSVMIYKKI